MKETNELEIREQLAETSHLRTIYEEHFKKIHEKKKSKLYGELLQLVRDGSEASRIVRQAVRLESHESITADFNSLEGKEKKLTKKLKEVKDEEQRETEQENFHRYNGG